jgi:hypothetical protein
MRSPSAAREYGRCNRSHDAKRPTEDIELRGWRNAGRSVYPRLVNEHNRDRDRSAFVAGQKQRFPTAAIRAAIFLRTKDNDHGR